MKSIVDKILVISLGAAIVISVLTVKFTCASEPYSEPSMIPKVENKKDWFFGEKEEAIEVRGSNILKNIHTAFSYGEYFPRWTVVGGYGNIRNHISGWPHNVDPSGKSDSELFRIHDNHHDEIGPVSKSQIDDYYYRQDSQNACPGGVCPTPQSTRFNQGSCPGGVCPSPQSYQNSSNCPESGVRGRIFKRRRIFNRPILNRPIFNRPILRRPVFPRLRAFFGRWR